MRWSRCVCVCVCACVCVCGCTCAVLLLFFSSIYSHTMLQTAREEIIHFSLLISNLYLGTSLQPFQFYASNVLPNNNSIFAATAL